MELRTVGDVQANVFVELPFKLVSDPAERLTVDHIIQDKDVPTKGSQVVRPYETLRNAIGSLQARIKLLAEYLERVENGKIKENPEILKNIQSVCNRLPTMTNEKFKQDFFTVELFYLCFYCYFYFFLLFCLFVNWYKFIGNGKWNDDDLFININKSCSTGKSNNGIK